MAVTSHTFVVGIRHDKCQMFGLEMDGMALIINFPLTPAISQNPNDLGVVEVLVKPIKRLRRDMSKTIVTIDRLRTKVDQYAPHSDFLKDVGGEIGEEFSHHTHRRWMRWLAQCPPSLSHNCLAEKVIRVVKTLLLNERLVFANDAEPIGGPLIDEPRDIIIWGRVLARPTLLVGNFCLLPDIRGRTENASGDGTE